MGNLVNREQKGYTEKCNEYMDYINEHIKNVGIAFKKLLFNPLKDLGESGIIGFEKESVPGILEQLETEIKFHDMSKYSDYEFQPYRVKFHPTDDEKYKYDNDELFKKFTDEAFGEAWKHHYCNNYHHPRFWKYNNIINYGNYGLPISYNTLITPKEVADDMPPVAILHMICDWEAMSIKFNSKTIDWFLSNKSRNEREDMSPNTLKTVKKVLEFLYDVELPENIE